MLRDVIEGACNATIGKMGEETTLLEANVVGAAVALAAGRDNTVATHLGPGS